MLDALFVDLDFDLVLLGQVLQFALLVAELGLLVLELLLANDPEVVDSLTLVLVETRQVLFLADFVFQSAMKEKIV